MFIGHRDAGYSVSLGSPEGDRSSNSHNNYCFTLHTHERNFILRAETQDDMDKWNTALNQVIDLPLTPQDSKCECVITQILCFVAVRVGFGMEIFLRRSF